MEQSNLKFEDLLKVTIDISEIDHLDNDPLNLDISLNNSHKKNIFESSINNSSEKNHNYQYQTNDNPNKIAKNHD